MKIRRHKYATIHQPHKVRIMSPIRRVEPIDRSSCFQAPIQESSQFPIGSGLPVFSARAISQFRALVTESLGEVLDRM